MSQAIRDFERSFVAENDLSSSQYRIVKLGTNDNEVAAATAGDQAVGVLQNKPKAGEPANVRFLATTKVEAGGAVTKGNYVKSDANGKAVASSADQENAVGVALEGTTNGDGDIIEIMLTPALERSTV